MNGPEHSRSGLFLIHGLPSIPFSRFAFRFPPAFLFPLFRLFQLPFFLSRQLSDCAKTVPDACPGRAGFATDPPSSRRLFCKLRKNGPKLRILRGVFEPGGLLYLWWDR